MKGLGFPLPRGGGREEGNEIPWASTDRVESIRVRSGLQEGAEIFVQIREFISIFDFLHIYLASKSFILKKKAQVRMKKA